MDLIKEYLNKSRNRLVDLTKRNKLINFNLNSKNTKHINIVSASLPQIWEAVSSGVLIPFNFIPDPQKEINPITNQNSKKSKSINYAKECDPNLFLDLPIEDRSEGNTLKAFQTLLYYSDLEKSIQKLKDDARAASEEKGLLTLHCMIGFLEWKESKDSAIIITSPLLLSRVQIEIARQKPPNQRFLLSGQEVGEDIWIVNPSLQIKLKNDYGIELPLLETGEYPASYFKRLLSLLSVHPEWSILHRVAIGNITFPRLSLYEDLDFQKWGTAENNLMLNHQVLTALLSYAYREPSDQFNQKYENDTVVNPIKGLVFDADSSQIEVIRRVLDGETMVLEGPPGTGKSQTIANLISAYLSRGKRVLFVAEKKAAIEVVEQRLAKVGLGEFCLNTHTDNMESKTALYEKLAKRLDYDEKKEILDQSFDNIYQETIGTISNLTNTLDSYYNNLEFVAEEGQSNLGHLLWTSLKMRSEYEKLSSQLKSINIPSALFISPTMLEISKGLLKNLENAICILDISPSDLRTHVLWTFESDFLDPFMVEEIEEHFKNMKTKLNELTEAVNFLFDPSEIKTINLENCFELKKLQSIQEASIDEGLFKRLMNNQNLEELIDKLNHIKVQFPKLVNSNNLKEDLLNLSNIIKLKIEYLKNPKSLEHDGSCYKNAESLTTLAHQLKNYSAFIKEISPKLYTNDSTKILKFAEEIKIILKIIEQLDDLDLYLLKNIFNQNIDWEEITLIANLTFDCDNIHKELSTLFLADLLNNHSKIEQLAKSLLSERFLKKLTPSWRYSYKYLSSQVIANKKIKKSLLIYQFTQLHKWSQKLFFLQQKKIDSGLLSEKINLNSEVILKLLNLRSKELFLTENTSLIYQTLIESGKTILDLQSLIRDFFGDAALDTLSQISSYLEINKNYNIEELIDQIDKDSSEIKFLAKSLETSGVEDIHNTFKLDEILLSIHEFFNSQELETLISNWSFKSLEQGFKLVAMISIPLKKTTRKFFSSVNIKYISKIEQVIKLSTELEILVSNIENMGFTIPKSIDYEDKKQISISNLTEWQKRISIELPKLMDWWKFQRELIQLEKQSSSSYDFVNQLLNEEITLKNLPKIFEILVIQNKVKKTILKSNSNDITINRMLQTQENFQKYDRKINEYGGKWAKKILLSQHINQGSHYGSRKEWTGLSLIKHELGKQKRRIAPRKLFKRSLESLQNLMPCFMMSPLSVAQYLPISQAPLFDLVIIDEASQLKPEEAFSAIVRGSQLLVVGDSKQLPPTSFFGAVLEDEDIEDDEAIDNESILDMAKAIFSSHSLRWHYRSKHDSLIYFSNQQFYDGRLIVCPSSRSVSQLVGVHLFQANGLYKNGENLEEANLVIEKAIMCMKVAPKESIGIVTINRQQQELIKSLLYAVRNTNSEVDSYLAYWEEKNEHCFVKNLENVQGDERDIIIISTVYGPIERGSKVLRRFGPINSSYGHRRLNVLCTRAKACMYVITSLQPSDILASDETTSSKGLEAFSKFLDFAGSGQLLTKKVSQEPESPFEEYVGKFLSDAGYDVDYQIGQAGFRIDIGIRHPACPYGFLAGIECDGATYHSHRAARDRDRLRQEILENHGWKIYRIWSTDWFYYPEKEKEKLLNWISIQIDHLLNNNFSNEQIKE